MNYAAIKTRDIANGPGVRVSLFVSGCRHRCKKCFNREAWDFAYGEPYTPSTQMQLLDAVKPRYIAGLSLLGGEPFEPENRRALIELLRAFRERFPHKSVWCYTGFTFEALQREGDDAQELLSLVDVLVDGPFVEELKDPSLLFRGSSNQRIIDVPCSLKQGEFIPLAGVWKRTMGSGNIEED